MKPTLTLLTALLLAPLAALHAADAPAKPNILVILADDLGYADIPAHGGQGLSMPHLDELTRQGVRFSKLRELKLQEQTLIVFLSDNGAPIDPLEVARQDGRKIKAPKGDAKGKGEDDAVNGSRNEPLRGRKGLTWEGGIRVPFVMAWKGTLPAGQTYDQPVISLDIAATALAAANTKPLPGTTLDGVNLLPFLKGENKGAPHERLFWRYADRNLFAVREGQWKLERSHTETAQLYDLDADISERNDLSAQHPDVVKRLQCRQHKPAAGARRGRAFALAKGMREKRA